MKEKYQQSILPKMGELAALISAGGSEAAAAELAGVSLSTFRRYRKRHPELEELFEIRRQLCAEMVESALLKRAIGYEDASGKEVPPDVRAAVFWLQNRCPENWHPAGRKSGGDHSEESFPEIVLLKDEAGL